MFKLTAKRASKSDPVKSFTYLISEVEKVTGLEIKKGDIFEATYSDGTIVVLNESRNKTLYSGGRAKHVPFETPDKTGVKVTHTLKSLKKLSK